MPNALFIVHLHRPSEVAPTQLSDETSSLSRSGTPFTVPTLTLLPPCTPTSSCLSATLRSPSLTSWDSWSSFESSDKEDDSISSTDSELSLSDSLFTSSDDDDNEEMEGEDESESTCNKQLQAEFGTEIIGNCIHVFPIVSSGIIADCSVAQSDDNDSKSDKFVTVSSTSSEEELGMISGIEDEDMDESQMVFTELQNTVPGMPAFIPPQVPVHSKCSITFKPAETNFVRYTTKPAPLTLSLPGDDSHIPTTPPPGPSTVKDIDAEEMWKEYAKNRSTAPEYFLFPPFTPEQEEWIVATNHPFKEYVLQTWQTSIHSSVQGWLEDLVN